MQIAVLWSVTSYKIQQSTYLIVIQMTLHQSYGGKWRENINIII